MTNLLAETLITFMPHDKKGKKRFFDLNRVPLAHLKEENPKDHRRVLMAFQGQREDDMAEQRKRNPDKCHGSMRQNENKKEDWHADIRGEMTVPPAVLRRLLEIHKAGGQPTLRVNVRQFDGDKGKWWSLNSDAADGKELSDWWQNFWRDTHPAQG